MRAFHVRFKLAGKDDWEDQGVHLCEEHGVEALQAWFRHEAERAWPERLETVTQVDFQEVQAPNDPFVAYAQALGIATTRTDFTSSSTTHIELELGIPARAAMAMLAQHFGPITGTYRQDGRLYRQFTVGEPGQDRYIAVRTARNEKDVLVLKHGLDAEFFVQHWN